jgi:hypothetical protein
MILIGLLFAIVGTGIIVYFNQKELSKKNKNRFKNIYSNSNYYDDYDSEYND